MKSLPAKYIVRLGKFVWTTMWRIMMSQLAPSNKFGEYIRPDSQFRNTIAVKADASYPAASKRYRLFVGMGCPWAHRTLVVRVLKGLEDIIAVSIVYPSANEGIWLLQSSFEDCNTVPELYKLAQPGYQGRCTVPILWDDETKTIVNNESAEIVEILNSQLNQFATNSDYDLYPENLQEQCDRWNEKIYHKVNNGVYRCGFAQTQTAYNQACTELFATLDEIDHFLATNRYLCGEVVTLADVRLFTTLVRFDTVYYGLFKCSLKRIQDYQYLSGYLRDLYQLPGVATTCDPDSVKQDYYGNLFPLNPGGIIPLGSNLKNLQQSHNRHKMKQLS
ncbi:Glutathionyl-hydroquinone reductase YqjG [Hyella patelloides LEGE 07179]|uniref:Glutathionyl-hydroquinone reductase YqjG n=1 Tax=Hyella patelloides LEGE 07179 TaxID=945734 RepID=A0A563VW20_9CYAN|nr:glutathione S-transferase C-terminal domain-containing protein [Hyella patelloides]VEP15595.1 Glutathionyl-hydroquinone reductase YqjG [Hyella patelloides LEGE 07179]